MAPNCAGPGLFIYSFLIASIQSSHSVLIKNPSLSIKQVAKMGKRCGKKRQIMLHEVNTTDLVYCDGGLNTLTN